MITRDQVLEVLSRHIGAGRGVHIPELVHEITGSIRPDPVAERRVRQCISDLREEGVAVCGHPSTGYHIAESAEELERCCEFLRARALHSLVLESRLRKIPLPELLGQLKITA